MSTKTKSRDKIDLHAMIGPLTQEPEPKTLMECLHEAGGFPFVARAVAHADKSGSDNMEPTEVGTDCKFTKYGVRRDCQPALYCPAELANVQANVRRWSLVGHKT